MVKKFRNCHDSVYCRTSRRRMQVVPKRGRWVGVCSHLHQVQRLEVSYRLLGDSRQSLHRLTLVITVLLHQATCFKHLHVT